MLLKTNCKQTLATLIAAECMHPYSPMMHFSILALRTPGFSAGAKVRASVSVRLVLGLKLGIGLCLWLGLGLSLGLVLVLGLA